MLHRRKKDNYCEDGEGYSISPLALGIIVEVKKKIYKGNKSASLIDNRRLVRFF